MTETFLAHAEDHSSIFSKNTDQNQKKSRTSLKTHFELLEKSLIIIDQHKLKKSPSTALFKTRTLKSDYESQVKLIT